MRSAPKKLRLFFAFFLICIMPVSAAFAEIKVFEKEIEEIVGKNQSQEQVEAFALQKAKRLAVEEAGTYISSLTVVRNYQLAKDEITALASGVVQARIVGVPSMRLENGVIHIRVKARIQVNTAILDQQIEQIMKEKGTLKKLEDERQKVKDLEKRLAGLKSTELKRLEDLNRQAVALEVERENQRLFREEQRLKAQKDIAKADIEILRQEQERSVRFARLQKEQESARKKELEEIAREQDRIRKAQLENESYWKDLARKAELSQADWISIDDALSLKQAVEEAKNLRTEITDISSRLDFQSDSSKKNLGKAYKQQIAVTMPILPPDPAPKDAFETSAEYTQRLEAHKSKVQNAKNENKEKIKQLKIEGDLKIAQLRVTALKHRIQVLEPFVHRLKTLQSKKFGLPDKKVKVTLGDPDADNSRFPINFEYNGRKWSKYWKYQDTKEARAFWKTRSHLVAQALFQLEGAGDKITYRFTASSVSHAGTKEERAFELETPKEFDEIAAWNRVKTVDLAEAEKDEKAAPFKYGFVDPVTGMEFIWVPGGCFQMGCGSWAGNCEKDEKPVHEVCVDEFLIGKYEVTQGQWQKVMGGNPSYFKEGDDYPVENVSWNDAQKFIRKLSALNNNKYKFRLPTEAEWEYACRSGGKPETYSGSDRIDRVAWYSGNSGGRSHRVGTKAPNGLGLYDMSGNVWEWCQEWYGDYPSGHVTDPKGPSSGSTRVNRGGAWFRSARGCRSAYRSSFTPVFRDGGLGFRLLRSP
ncbi:MAG: SUMF1/EgtB/PvdO family nonheme iron enzyme [Proteobacteria bacterium]|nr:SUMF1/EgtB/PvdO family nonheme iron enzyme [Pseudomonadota bacterium]